jgi:transcription elongation factor Elf1
MNLVDLQYIDLISHNLQKFKRVNNGTYNFRCPICGDSQKNKNKARGYIYTISGNFNYKCHNCGINISLSNFLKTVDLELYKKYYFEKYKSRVSKNTEQKIEVTIRDKIRSNKKVLIDLPYASKNTVANQYLIDRKLNPNKFYYCGKFKSWINQKKPNSFTEKSLFYDDERIIIPLIYENELIGIQGRALGDSPIKYITIMFNENAPKVYNFDNVNLKKPVYITEGPFDSEFINNAISMCGADLNIDKLNLHNIVWIYDNEPRNKEILDRIEKRIDSGDSVVLWPSSIHDKDINKMVLSGYNVEELIKLNTYSGIEAKIKFTVWKRAQL